LNLSSLMSGGFSSSKNGLIMKMLTHLHRVRFRICGAVCPCFHASSSYQVICTNTSKMLCSSFGYLLLFGGYQNVGIALIGTRHFFHSFMLTCENDMT
jgi:hypothetical protein